VQGVAAASFQGALWHHTFLCLKKDMFLTFFLRLATRHDKKLTISRKGRPTQASE